MQAKATVFAANDAFTGLTLAVGLDGVTLLAPYPRKGGEFVRLQCCLEPGHWLDADTILEDCTRGDGQWIWSLRFVGLDELQHAELDALLRRHRAASPRRSAPTHPPPARSSPSHTPPLGSAPASAPAPSSAPTHAPPEAPAAAHASPHRSTGTHPPPAREERPSELRLRRAAALEASKSRGSLAELYRQALKEVREVEKAHRELIGSDDDSLWQARNWGRKSG